MLAQTPTPTTLPPLPGQRTAIDGLLTGQDASIEAILPLSKTQSYISILEDALEQLAVLGDIAPDVGKTDNKPLGEEVTRILKDQRALEARYQELLLEQDRLKALPNKTKYKESQLAILDITNELQQSTQVLARSLKTHPSVAQNLLKIQQERSSLQALMGKTIRELRESRFDSLVSTVEEEYRKRNTLQNTINRENEASNLLKSLQHDLHLEKRLLEEETTDRNQVIQQLKDTIQEINALTTSEQKYIKKETKAHESSVRQQCQHKETLLDSQKQTLLLKISQEQKAHSKIAEFLTRQREGLERQIQEWMTKYEEDTENKANELEALKQRRTQDLDRFEELVQAYEGLEKIVEEDRALKLKEAEEARVARERERAATRIQRWYRKHKKRIAEAQAAASKSAKGPKKGGAKGKAAATAGGKASAPGTAKSRGKTPKTPGK
ncbi:hypothetical protein HK097_006722 [Rhizophlyctis rosea]|uniref:Dynein regulatory complex protein 9 n=1 Tax=Rhizophlyctis rosea TaxID=64517 RepID=A0AAD5SEM2_9FUNG|nr:hypothetical protein HK097_006722 [Rhizophlyctis rosea]